MPQLIRLYIHNVLIGFALSAVFVAAILWLNVAGLGRLILSSPDGWLAALMLFIFNGLVFAGVQFSIKIMTMHDRPGGGGTPRPIQPGAHTLPVLVKVTKDRRGR